MKKLNLLLTLGIVALSAEEQVEFEPSFHSGMPLPKEYSIPIISKSTREENSLRFSVSANFNEYQAIVDSMELAFPSNTLDGFYPGSSPPEGSIVTFDFDYHPGFQVGFVLDTPYDTWSFGGGYFWFRGHSHGSVKPATNTYYISPVFPGPFANFLNSIEADWDLDIDMIDIYLERAYFSGRRLSLNPFLGLRSGWIRQDFDLTATIFSSPSNFQTADSDSRAWMMGPKLGFQSNYLVGKGFSLFGNLATSFLYTRYNTLTLNYVNNLDETTFLKNSGLNTFRSIMDAGLGINWGLNGRCRVNFNAAYNLSVLFAQNMDRTLIAIAGLTYTAPANLYLSGLSVGASFGF